MVRVVMILCGLLLVGMSAFPVNGIGAEKKAAEPLADDGSHIQINSPKDGDTVGSTFELKYDFHAGSKAHHAHVFLDGAYQKGFKGTFSGLAPGAHEIKVQAATKDHKLLPATSSVHVDVK